MRTEIFRYLACPLLLTIASVAQSASILYTDQGTFLAALPPAQATTWDFETASGFPTAGAGAASYVGNIDDVTFVGITHAMDSGQAFSGVEAGFSCCFGVGAVDFTSLPQQPYAAGFFGLDLTPGEIIRVIVAFSNGDDAVYDINLDGADSFTPIFFGLVDTERTIRAIQLFGAEAATPNVADRAWLIDDLTIAAVPLPGAWVMLATGFACLAGRIARRRLR